MNELSKQKCESSKDFLDVVHPVFLEVVRAELLIDAVLFDVIRLKLSLHVAILRGYERPKDPRKGDILAVL